MDKIEFPQWLRQELEIREWSQVDLSRKTGISTAQITRIISGERGFGIEALASISNALEVSPITILRKAGLLPPGPDDKINFEDWKYMLEQMTDAEREEFWRFGQMKIEMRQEKEKNTRVGGLKKSKAASVEYKSPHKFRHGHIVYARSLARNMEEVKAISQNVMHANSIITDQVYSALKTNQVQSVIFGLGTQNKKIDQAEILRLIDLLKDQLK